MKLPFFRKPVRYIPAKQRENNLQDVRERIISVLLGSAITLGALAFIAAAIPALRTRQYFAIGVYIVCYAWILIVTLQRRRFSYTVKVYSLSYMLYILGFMNLIQNGLSADAGVFLLSFTVVTSLMIGPRSGLFALIISISTFSLVGFLMSSRSIVPPVLTDYRESMDWVSGGAVLVLLSTILTLSLSTILRGLTDSIEKVKILAIDTDRDREQIRLRSQDLQRRLAQMRAFAEIEHTIRAVREPKELMQKVVDLLCESFGLYHVGLFMLGENILSMVQIRQDGESNSGDKDAVYFTKSGTEVILQAGTGKIVPEGYKWTVSGGSTAGWAMSNRKPRAVEITGKKDAYTAEYLPLAHTELALPLLSHDHVNGVLMIHSTQSDAFDEDDIALFQSSADSLATALENARLFKQNQDDLEQIRTLQKQYISRAWAETERVYGNLSYTYEGSQENRDGLEHREEIVPADVQFSTYITPISLRDQTIGQLILETGKPTCSNEDRAFIESVVTEAALALENARLLTETQRRANHDRLVADINRTVQASTDIETILSSAIRELGRKLQASEAIISLNVVAEDKPQVQTEQMDEPVRSSSNDKQNEAGGGNPPQLADEGSEQQEVTA
jgi:GAF domain-containing protein